MPLRLQHTGPPTGGQRHWEHDFLAIMIPLSHKQWHEFVFVSNSMPMEQHTGLYSGEHLQSFKYSHKAIGTTMPTLQSHVQELSTIE